MIKPCGSKLYFKVAWCWFLILYCSTTTVLFVEVLLIILMFSSSHPWRLKPKPLSKRSWSRRLMYSTWFVFHSLGLFQTLFHFFFFCLVHLKACFSIHWPLLIVLIIISGGRERHCRVFSWQQRVKTTCRSKGAEVRLWKGGQQYFSGHSDVFPFLGNDSLSVLSTLCSPQEPC